MTPKEFCEAQIKAWQQASKKASESADLKAFEHAERELKNYREMLKAYV